MSVVWVKEKKMGRAVKISIGSDGDVVDLCQAMKLNLRRLRDVDEDHIVISRTGLELARDLRMETIDAFTAATAVDFEIISEGEQSVDEISNDINALTFSTVPNQSSETSFSESLSPALGLATLVVLIKSIDTQKDMEDHFNDKLYWTYPDKLKLDATFGEYTNLPRGGRVEQMRQLWISILKSNTGDKDKKGVLYFHGSPGIGKTYILRELYSRKIDDIPIDYKSEAEGVNFLVLDFNRGACTEICSRESRSLIMDNPNLFAMSRLFWINFAHQKNLTWGTFIEMVVIPMIRAKFSTLLLAFMVQHLEKRKKNIKIGNKCVILVDEILKTREFDDDFADKVRSSICSWMGKTGVCDVVLFSTLDLKFMTNECTHSGRPVRMATTLPLLKVHESVALFHKQIESVFVDDEGTNVCEKEVLQMFALVTGGHPRSIQYIIEKCNACKGSTSLMTIINEAAESLCAAYIGISSWKRLFEVVLLAQKVKKEGRLSRDQTSEKFRILVMSGVLIDSFDDRDDEFVPVVPELFLHAWIKKSGSNCLSDEPRRLLQQILNLRSNFTSVKYETLHSSWENLIRHIRQCDKLYESIPFNDLYRLELRSNSAPAASCRVDGSSILREIMYENKKHISISPNEIYYPSSRQNPGWDRMIVMEAFPLKSLDGFKYLLPLFIQNKFSADASTTKLTKKIVSKDMQSCLDFLNEYVEIDNAKYCFLSSERNESTSKPKLLENDLILLYVGEQKTNADTLVDAPPNVMFCLGQDLQTLYGPTLMNFVDSLVPDETLSARRRTIVTDTASNQN